MARADGAPRRARARRGDGERLRAEILVAAERMLLETGDESALSIRAIADAVGVSPPSIYLHFADRNELVFAVCEGQFAELARSMESAAAGLNNPMERIEARGRAYIEFGLTKPEQYRVLMTGRPDATPDRFADERLSHMGGFGALLEDVQAAIDAGQIRLADPALVASGLWMMAHGITSLLIAKPDFPWPEREQLITHVLDAYVTGLSVT